MEKLILASCLKDRRFYERILAERPDFSHLGNEVFALVRDYYDRDRAAESISKDSFLIVLSNSGVRKKHLDALILYVQGLDDNASVPNIVEILKHVKLTRLSGPLAVGLANGDFEAIQRPIRDFLSVLDEGAVLQSESEGSDREILRGLEFGVESEKTNGELIKLWPKTLSDITDGGAYRGNHIIVYARPEIGKTLFALNLSAGFLKQGLVVLYIGNEDPSHSMRQRMLQRLTRKTRQEIESAGGFDASVASGLAKENGGDNFVFASLAPGNFREISALADEFKADVIVLDQLRNLEMDGESRTLELDKAARQARNLGKSKNALVVSLTQAGESAEGKIVLGRSDIDFSKTGIPGACDLMVGIGADSVMERNGERCIATPKNKLSGKHEHFFVKFDTARGIVEE